LQVLGQVTGPLANSVLKAAYVKMLPRSVAHVLFDLSQLIAHVLASLRALEGGGGSNSIDVDRLKLVFQTYLDDVQRRVVTCLHQHEPTEEDTRKLASSRCSLPIPFDDVDSIELKDKFLSILAREALGSWQPSYNKALFECCGETSRAHQKWQRSIDHYLTQSGVDVATKQRVLLDAKDLRIESTASGQNLLQVKVRDGLVAKHADKIPVARSKPQLFQRPRFSFAITPKQVLAFVLELFAAWRQAAEAEVVLRCLKPVEVNFNEMVQSIQDISAQCLAGKTRKQEVPFDFSFVHKLEEVLPTVAAFSSREEDGDHETDKLGAGEADRCEAICRQVREALQGILR